MFEWNEIKAESNALKHSVTFNFATKVFEDSNKVTITNNREDYKETRYIILSEIDNRIYVVVYTLRMNRDNQSVVRIISARKANSREVKDYDNNQL